MNFVLSSNKSELKNISSKNYDMNYFINGHRFINHHQSPLVGNNNFNNFEHWLVTLT